MRPEKTDLSIAMERRLGEPFAMEYQEDVLKTRRNLLIAGALGLLVSCSNIKIHTQAGFSFVGIPFQGEVHHSVLAIGLLGTIIYLIIHFLWNSIDAIQEYRLRRTGTRTEYQTIGRSSATGIDGPIHPRQSTLYNWWLEEAEKINAIPEQLLQQQTAYNQAIDKLQKLCQQYDDPNSQNLRNALQAARGAKQASEDLNTSIENASQIFSSKRIPVSLKRFDEAFNRHALSQNARWLCIEFGLPMLLGIGGCIGIIIKLCQMASL